MRALGIVSTASGDGKTLLSSSLLYHFKGRVRPYKVGPDFIDTQFHKRLSGVESVNLDTFMMSSGQMVDTFYRYAKEINIIEGAMGFYDGIDRGCSSYSILSTLNIASILVIDASGSYITISAILKGLREYREPNPIRAIVLNRVSSKSHYERIVDIISKDHPDILVAGWIKKGLKSINSIHLGLDLEDLSIMESVASEVLENIDIDRLLAISSIDPKDIPDRRDIKKLGKKATLVNDENFSFLYFDNYNYLKESFDEVEVVSAIKDEEIDKSSDIVIICGGYVESDRAYSRVKDSNLFRDSLISYAQSGGKIYAECAGLLYLGKFVDDKEMSGVLPLNFTLNRRFVRLGYYFREDGIKGHAFHYTEPSDESLKMGFRKVKKYLDDSGEYGEWIDSNRNILGTYLHTFWRVSRVVEDMFR